MDERGDGNNAETGPNGANLNDSFLNVGGADPEGQDFEDLLNDATFEDHHDDTVRSGGLFYDDDDGDDDLGPPESPEFPPPPPQERPFTRQQRFRITSNQELLDEMERSRPRFHNPKNFCWKNSCTTCIIHVIFEASIELPELMDTGRQTYLHNFVGFLNAGGTIINPTETIRLLQRDHLVEDCIEDLLNNQYPVCLQ